MTTFEILTDDETTRVTLKDGGRRAEIDDRELDVEWSRQANGRSLMRIGPRIYRIDDVEFDGNTVSFTLNGRPVSAQVKDEQDLLLERLGFKSDTTASAGEIKAPMPGKILEVIVKKGDEVDTGDPVAILEAMKMENELKSPLRGTVSDIHIQAGDSVEKNQPLMEIDPSG